MRIIGSRTCPDARRLRDFAVRNRVPHRWVDLDADEGARHLLRNLGVASDATPIVIWRRDVVLRNPAIAEVVRAIAPASRRSPRPVPSLGAEPSSSRIAGPAASRTGRAFARAARCA